ncbi:hypothetical protein SBRY_110149 [Actinacidiphila bryophytorum]|uniref:Uncharacterized protein n=1 Tax=Actinacidiphila bryophytorum TaxID=1436133 RepID=A0A9W4GZP4_9ACTN|nr:hypothetical protein SBRY_110149 [Actinacidiphila bryophytorum]
MAKPVQGQTHRCGYDPRHGAQRVESADRRGRCERFVLGSRRGGAPGVGTSQQRCSAPR